MNSTNDKRQTKILKLFKSLEKSGLSAKEYFSKYQTPISLSQYYRLKKRYDEHGDSGLFDQRHHGNARKLSVEQVQLLRGILAYTRHLSSSALQTELREKWHIEIDQSRINQFRRQFELPRIQPEAVRQETIQFAGIEIFAAIVHHIGILEHWHTTIRRRLQQVQRSDNFNMRSKRNDHNYARRRNGTFSPRYNRIPRVRRMKFASIEDKVKDKDLSRLSLYEQNETLVNRKNLAALLLPLVTNNGAVRSLDQPLGSALANACGYNYKNATLDKYLRELKYLQISHDLIECNAQFWGQFWRQYDQVDHKLACYYIDGNVKPLWSSKRCRKGKVSMLGRVMNCLEQVVINDSFGHPLYFQTFSGYAELQKCALQSMEQLDQLLGKEQGLQTPKSRCSRALVFDAAGNAVQTLRAFSKSKYHYITILDSNQIHPRKFKHLSKPESYHYGDATLTDCEIELIDSKEPKYIFEDRAIEVQWHHGRSCCLVTSIPRTLFSASEVVKAYFDRWPCNEKQFAMMKATLCFFQVVGYGKKRHDDDKMLERIKDLQTVLQQLHHELKEPLQQISDKEQRLHKLFDEERQLKEKSKIKDGNRIQSKSNKEALTACQRQIEKTKREIYAIEKPHKEQFKIWKKKSKEFARIQGKKEVYQVDVELDQLLTSFRLSLANTLTFFAKEILNEKTIEMNTLIQSLLFLSGKIEQLPECRKVYLNRNKKDPKFMAKLEKGLAKLNKLEICHPNGSVYKFALS